VCFVVFIVCLYICVCECLCPNNNHQTKHKNSTTSKQHNYVQCPLRECCSIWSGASGLTYYCAPLVCVSDVMDSLDAWQYNKPKTKIILTTQHTWLGWVFETQERKNERTHMHLNTCHHYLRAPKLGGSAQTLCWDRPNSETQVYSTVGAPKLGLGRTSHTRVESISFFVLNWICQAGMVI